MKQAVSMETLGLVGICTADTIITAVLWCTGSIEEANPFMAAMLRCSVAMFCAVKLGMLIPLAALVEWYRRYNPIFVKRVMRFGIAAYTGLYIIGVLMVNV